MRFALARAFGVRLFVLPLLLFFFSSCDPVPFLPLTIVQKQADFNFLVAKYDENYALLQYKESRNGFKFDELVRRYLDEALTTRSNEEFYRVLLRFVAEFKDAHNSMKLTVSNLPEHVRIAYLGFSGKRKGPGFLVTSLLPTIDTVESAFPVRIGDVITHVDGIPVVDYVKQKITPYVNLGRDESNATALMNMIFNRISLRAEIPTEPEIKVTIRKAGRKGDTEVVTLPWIVKDLFDFRLEQDSVARLKDGSLTRFGVEDLSGKHRPFGITFLDYVGRPVRVADLFPDHQLLKGAERAELDSYRKLWAAFSAGIQGGDVNMEQLRALVPQQPQQKGRLHKFFKRLETFRLPTEIASWTTEPVADLEDLSGIERLKQERHVPGGVIPIEEAQTFPAYVTLRQRHNKQGIPSGPKVPIGVLRIDTFSPSQEEAIVLDQVQKTLARFQELGVNDIVVDLLDNGGGSLSLVLKLAQLFSPTDLKFPQIQFALNNNWLEDLQRGALWGPSDGERQIQKTLFGELLAEKKEGRRISKPKDLRRIMPFQLKPNLSLGKRFRFNMVLLTNEMCASAADIFASLFKHNELATLIGGNTMGAGGNVVNHFQAPASHFDIRMTESLLLNPDGTVLENNGIAPHVPMEVSESVDEQYETVVEAGVEYLVNPKARADSLEKFQCKRALMASRRVVVRR